MKTNSGAPSQKGGLVRSPRHLLAGFKALSSSQCGQNGLVLQQRCVAMWQEDFNPKWHRGCGWKAQLGGGRGCGLPFAQLWFSAVVYTQRGWEVFTQAPRSHCVWFSTPPGRLICECVELQCTRRPNHRAVFCFSTGYTCPKSRVHSCCRLRVCLTFEKLHPPDKPEGTIVSAENRQRLKSHEMEFSFLLGTREHGIK